MKKGGLQINPLGYKSETGKGFYQLGKGIKKETIFETYPLFAMIKPCFVYDVISFAWFLCVLQNKFSKDLVGKYLLSMIVIM